MELLDTMEEQFKNGNAASKPDGYTYSSIICCFNKFGRIDAPQKAEELMKRMVDLYNTHGGNPPGAGTRRVFR